MDGAELVTYTAAGGSIAKFLGPTLDLLGDDLKTWAERRRHNLGRIFDTLEQKCDVEDLESPGSVPPRVLRGVLEDGSFVEDDIGVEYFAGVLASSRTSDGKDDASVALIEVMNGLSSAQIRAHYFIYGTAQKLVAGREAFDPYGSDRGQWSRVALPLGPLMVTLAEGGLDLTGDALGAVMRGLKRTDLIDANGGWRAGSPDHLQAERAAIWPAPALVCTLSNFGIELFCAAHGFRTIEDFARSSAEFRARFSGDVNLTDPIVMTDLPTSQAD